MNRYKRAGRTVLISITILILLGLILDGGMFIQQLLVKLIPSEYSFITEISALLLLVAGLLLYRFGSRYLDKFNPRDDDLDE